MRQLQLPLKFGPEHVYTAPGLPGLHQERMKGEKGMVMAVVRPTRGRRVVSRCMFVLSCGRCDWYIG